MIAIRKNTRARKALRLISSPQDGPTALRLTSSTSEPVSSASWALISWAAAVSSSGSASTRSCTSPSAVRLCTVTPSSPASVIASWASATDTSPAGTSQTTPPSKSMPRLRPRCQSDRSPMPMMTPLIRTERQNMATNLMFVSP